MRGLRRGDRQRLGSRACDQPKIQLGLPGGQPLRRGSLQRSHPGLIMGRTQVLDLA